MTILLTPESTSTPEGIRAIAFALAVEQSAQALPLEHVLRKANTIAHYIETGSDSM